MRVSARGAFTIAAEEGLVPTRYRDVVGVDTFGIGHTAAAGKPDPRTMPFAMPTSLLAPIREAIRVFEADLRAYTKDVQKAMGPMAQHELDGWVSWHFNTGGAHSSRAVRLWREGKKDAAVKVMLQWNKGTVKGKKRVIPALDARRKLEAAMILNAAYPGNLSIPVWGTNGKGRVIWSAVDRIDFDEYMEYSGRNKTVPTAPAAGAGAVAVVTGLALFWEEVKGAFAWVANLF